MKLVLRFLSALVLCAAVVLTGQSRDLREDVERWVAAHQRTVVGELPVPGATRGGVR